MSAAVGSRHGVLRWEDPPEPVTGTAAITAEERIAWPLIAVELMSMPGRWAVVHESTQQVSHVTLRIKNGKSPWFRPAGSFEACQRAAPEGMTVVYARYVGEPAGDAS